MKKTFAPAMWQSPYPVALGVTQGRWCDTADQYKRWAVQQTWCAKTLAERRDIPAWWKDGPDVHVCEVRTYDNTRTCTGSYYPKLHDHLRTFREKIDGPIVAMLAGWENHRRWTGGDYFPVFDADQAKPVIQQLRQDGFRPFFFLSGLVLHVSERGPRRRRDCRGAEVPGVVCRGRKQRQTERVRAERIQPGRRLEAAFLPVLRERAADETVLLRRD